METLPLIFMTGLGLCAGSFALAMTMRMQARKPWVNDRSKCDHCKKILQWYDLVPLISWLSTKGNCRYCNKKLSPMYPVTELATALVFVGSYVFWPYGYTGSGIAAFITWLVMVTLMVSLVIFDLKWYILPDRITYTLIGLALSTKLFWIVFYQNYRRLLDIVVSVAVGAGVFWLLYVYSKGKYIGFGDVKYGIFYGVLLASGFKSLLVLSVASLLGTIAILPSLAKKKTSLTSTLPFGPYLIIATYIVYIFGDRLVDLLTTSYLFP